MKSRDTRSTIILRIGEHEKGYAVRKKLDAYRRSKGWTWRHLALVGMIEAVYEDNPILAEEIAELLFDNEGSS